MVPQAVRHYSTTATVMLVRSLKRPKLGASPAVGKLPDRTYEFGMTQMFRQQAQNKQTNK